MPADQQIMPPPLDPSCTFHALNFGAVGDDNTDNAGAFSACLATAIEAGGCRIIIPPFQAASWFIIEIVGEGHPAPVFGTIGSCELNDDGTIIKCQASPGPAVISASPNASAPCGQFSMLHVIIRDPDVRTCDDPEIGGIDLQFVRQC